ncbi:MAG: hypothetical protein GXP49_08290 [Deltaproteobacteria bacterium]|nr:hypothetical protein [Deltaproteobacteria bacterium]
MAKPFAMVIFEKCKPFECSPDGKCPATKACEYKVLRQEEPGEPPFQIGLCKGCGNCVTACPLKAIKLG